MKSAAWVTFIGSVFLLALLVDYQVCAKPPKKKPVIRDKESEEDDLDDISSESSEEESEFQFAQKILEQQFIKQSPGTNLINMFASFFKGQNPFGTGSNTQESPTTPKPKRSTTPTPSSSPNLMESFVKGFLMSESDGSQSPLKFPPSKLKGGHISSSSSFLPKPFPTKILSTDEKRIMGIEDAINQVLGLEKEVRQEIERLKETTPPPPQNQEETTTDIYQFFFPPITTTTTTEASTTTEEVIEIVTNPSFEDLEFLLSSLDKRIGDRETATENIQLLLTSREPLRLETLRTSKVKQRRKQKTTKEPSSSDLNNLNPNLLSPSQVSPGSVTNLIMSQVRNGNVQTYLLKNLIQFMQSPVETIEAVECSLFQICDFNYFN